MNAIFFLDKWKEVGTQTEEDDRFYSPPSKKSKLSNGDNTDCVSPCSSATPSESVDLGIVIKTNGNGNNNWDEEESKVLRGLIKTENDRSSG